MAQFTSTESLAQSTTTSSTPGDKVVHTVTTPSGRNYIVFFSCQTSVSNVATRSKVDLKVDGVIIATFSPRVNNNAEDDNIFFFEKVTGKSSDFDCEIEFSSTDNTNTARIENARIVLWDYTDVSGLDLQYGSDDNNFWFTSSYYY